MNHPSRYTLIQRIAYGGMAEVWKAHAQGDHGFRKAVAIKRILPQYVSDPEIIRTLVEEAQLVASLIHPNIVQVLDFGELSPGDYFLAMDYVAGTNLWTFMQRVRKAGATLPCETALYIAVEICKALGYAHSRSPRVVHRDISPGNVLVSFDGEVKVTDFGIAKVEGVAHDSANRVKGKLRYMAPEQARREEIDHRADLFSLGATLFWLFTGRHLFDAETHAAQYGQVAGYEGPRERDREVLPEPVRDIVLRLIAAHPEHRYADAVDVESDLLSLLDVRSLVVTRTSLAQLVRQYCPESYQREAHPPKKEHTEKNTKGKAMDSSSKPAPREETGATLVVDAEPTPSQIRRRRIPGILAGISGAALLTAAGGMTVWNYRSMALAESTPAPELAAVEIGAGETWVLAAPIVAATDEKASDDESGSEEPADTDELSRKERKRMKKEMRRSEKQERAAMKKSEEPETPKKDRRRAKKRKRQELTDNDAERAAMEKSAMEKAATETSSEVEAEPEVESESPIVRKIPTLSSADLTDCDAERLAQIQGEIRSAIRKGAPLYNEGDRESCFRIYEGTALRIQNSDDTCAVVRQTLADGLSRARGYQDDRLRAWAMRDAFDGILSAKR